MNTKDMAIQLDRLMLVTLIDKRIDGRLNTLALLLAAKPVSTRPVPVDIQLCPVPKCSGRAAPIFGMVCAQHKNVSKTTLAKYRAARKAKKA